MGVTTPISTVICTRNWEYHTYKLGYSWGVLGFVEGRPARERRRWRHRVWRRTTRESGVVPAHKSCFRHRLFGRARARALLLPLLRVVLALDRASVLNLWLQGLYHARGLMRCVA